ncbi:unnamed protein product [Amoebophrya sp. A120]|nr:unnamed protein product [Amoebophrya sp. A120]|eukprot:GSA120T00010838001.1
MLSTAKNVGPVPKKFPSVVSRRNKNYKDMLNETRGARRCKCNRQRKVEFAPAQFDDKDVWNYDTVSVCFRLVFEFCFFSASDSVVCDGRGHRRVDLCIPYAYKEPYFCARFILCTCRDDAWRSPLNAGCTI